MNEIRKNKLYFFYKKAYENQSVFVNGRECDLSLLWNSVEDNKASTIKVSKLVQTISKKDIAKHIKKNNNIYNFEYPILIYNNKIIDGYNILLNKLKNKEKFAKVIFISEKDIEFSKMD